VQSQLHSALLLRFPHCLSSREKGQNCTQKVEEWWKLGRVTSLQQLSRRKCSNGIKVEPDVGSTPFNLQTSRNCSEMRYSFFI
ncbi:hypothetical protein M5D96_002146, partial [Drosophila gunungcola]